MQMISKELHKWLKHEWKVSNHPKYQQYFQSWENNLTDQQIRAFDKMRVADYIQHDK